MALRHLAWLSLLAAAFLAPLASAASATAEPPVALPGDRIVLVYTDDAALLDVRLGDSVTCTIEGPTPVGCAAANELVVARVPGGARTYAFEIEAPPTTGAYVARFARTSILALPPPAAGDAEVGFLVEPPAPIPDPTATPSDTVTPGSLDLADDGPSGGAARWLLSLFMATGSTTAAVALARRPGGL